MRRMRNGGCILRLPFALAQVVKPGCGQVKMCGIKKGMNARKAKRGWALLLGARIRAITSYLHRLVPRQIEVSGWEETIGMV